MSDDTENTPAATNIGRTALPDRLRALLNDLDQNFGSRIADILSEDDFDYIRGLIRSEPEARKSDSLSGPR